MRNLPYSIRFRVPRRRRGIHPSLVRKIDITLCVMAVLLVLSVGLYIGLSIGPVMIVQP